jgi:hypothetical protein
VRPEQSHDGSGVSALGKAVRGVGTLYVGTVIQPIRACCPRKGSFPHGCRGNGILLLATWAGLILATSCANWDGDELDSAAACREDVCGDICATCRENEECIREDYHPTICVDLKAYCIEFCMYGNEPEGEFCGIVWTGFGDMNVFPCDCGHCPPGEACDDSDAQASHCVPMDGSGAGS